MVQSTIPSGTITSIDHTAAARAEGVIAVLTPFNAPKLPLQQQPGRRHVSILQEPTVFYNGQPIALVVAHSLDQARYAATLLKISYKSDPAQLDFLGHLNQARAPHNGNADSKRGDIAASLAKSAKKIEVTYTTPIQHHNPMEPHATTAWWDGDKLIVYNSTQYIVGDKMTLARTFGIPLESVHVECPFTGGGFGSKGSMWSHVILAAMASKVTGKPVKISVDRGQMFGSVGGRPTTYQKITLGATPEGKLLAIQHDVIMHTSVMEDFVEGSANQTRLLYDSESNVTSHRMVDMNVGVCTYTRAPGENTGTMAFECALDELAHELKIDPVQIRLINYAEKDPRNDHPWTSKHLREAYTQAADRFGWSKRNPTPGQLREGNNLIGYGMATATYGAGRSAAGATVRILPDGTAYVGSATHELGTGMYTIMAQTCALALGLDPSQIKVQLGDSTLPNAPVAGGSQSTASVMPAVLEAATQARQKLADLATKDKESSLCDLPADDIEAKDGHLISKSTPTKSDSYKDIIRRNGGQPVEVTANTAPGKERANLQLTILGSHLRRSSRRRRHPHGQGPPHRRHLRHRHPHEQGHRNQPAPRRHRLGHRLRPPRRSPRRPRLRPHRQRKPRRIPRPRQRRRPRNRRHRPRHPRPHQQPPRSPRHRRNRHHRSSRRHRQRHLQRHRQTPPRLPLHPRQTNASLTFKRLPTKKSASHCP